ncbi:DUF4145 domain-containing protein [Exiguobacterium artemiae]
MYMDFLKGNYEDIKDLKEKELLINRDKKHLEKIVQDRITYDIENIVNRWYEIDDIGLINDTGNFITLLEEAEELYSFGYYFGSIALIGTAAEDLCKSKSNSGETSQASRIKALIEEGKITNSINNKLHNIRLTRNKYIHSNKPDNLLNEKILKKQSLQTIENFKDILRFFYEDVEQLNLNEKTEAMQSEKNSRFIQFKYKHRNLLESEDINLQIPTDEKRKVVTSIFKVLEVDIDTERFKEITFFDIEMQLPVIVDLTFAQSDRIRDLKLEKNNVVVASILSNVSSMGQTEEWILLDVHGLLREGL